MIRTPRLGSFCKIVHILDAWEANLSRIMLKSRYEYDVKVHYEFYLKSIV